MFEGVENNPGLWDFTIDKVIRASRNQDYSQYQELERMQCSSNAYIAIILSAIKDINFGNLMILITSLMREI